MERNKPRSERARRNKLTVSLLMQRRHKAQQRLNIIERRQMSLGPESHLPSQLIIWNKKELEETS